MAIKMDFVRTHVRNQTMLPSLRGIVATTTDCKGPYISQDRGMDTMCCTKCYIVRQQIYAEAGAFITNKLCIDYLYHLKERQSDCVSACILTTCGHPLLYVPVSKSDLEADNVRETLKEQFLLLKELHLVDIVDKDHIGFTQMGVPVVFPSNETTFKDTYGGDEGVKIEDGVLIIIDPEAALASGKWSYVIGYYTALNLLYGINERMMIF